MAHPFIAAHPQQNGDLIQSYLYLLVLNGPRAGHFPPCLAYSIDNNVISETGARDSEVEIRTARRDFTDGTHIFGISSKGGKALGDEEIPRTNRKPWTSSIFLVKLMA